jgi:predicted CoA-binding protein
MNDDELMRKILQESTTIAVIGASDKQHRASHGVMKFLQDRGYRCIPVSPRLAGQSLLGETVYAALSEIPEPVDTVDMFINSAAADALTDEAIDIGAKFVWMQLGVSSADAAERARKAGVGIIMDRCPAQEWHRLGL